MSVRVNSTLPAPMIAIFGIRRVWQRHGTTSNGTGEMWPERAAGRPASVTGPNLARSPRC